MRSAIPIVLALAVLAIAWRVSQRLSMEKHAMAQQPSSASGTMLAHMVYFSLNEPSDDNKRKLIEACHKYLTDHPGTVFYAAGTCAGEYDRPVNDRDYDVALQLVFKDRAAQDAYQVSERHTQFVDECRSLWKKVRVFDADVAAAPQQQ